MFFNAVCRRLSEINGSSVRHSAKANLYRIKGRSGTRVAYINHTYYGFRQPLPLCVKEDWASNPWFNLFGVSFLFWLTRFFSTSPRLLVSDT